jgi:hypothetical protein
MEGELMTLAICPSCGESKFGAFSNCHRCGHDPASAKELAICVLLSDHYYTIQELKHMGIEIAKTGNLPIFAERRQTEIIATIESSHYLDMLLKRS